MIVLKDAKEVSLGVERKEGRKGGSRHNLQLGFDENSRKRQRAKIHSKSPNPRPFPI